MPAIYLLTVWLHIMAAVHGLAARFFLTSCWFGSR